MSDYGPIDWASPTQARDAIVVDTTPAPIDYVPVEWRVTDADYCRNHVVEEIRRWLT